MALFPGADDELLDRLQQLLNVTQTEIAELPVKPESKALYEVCKVASRIKVHESCDCWHDAYVMLWIGGKLYRLLVEFKPCLAIYKRDWLSSVVGGLELVDIHCKDQARMSGPNFHGEPRDKWPDTVSILVSTGAALLLVSRATLAVSYGGLQALIDNFLRDYDPRKKAPGAMWLTTPEPFNYLVVDDCGAEVYFLVFEAGGRFVEARVYKPQRHRGTVNIISLGGVRRRIKTLQDTATDAGLTHPVLLGCEVTQVILSAHASSAVFVGPIDDTLDDKIEAKFARYYGPHNENSPYLASDDFWTSALSKKAFDAWAADTPTLEQQEILDAQEKAIETINGTAPGMVGADKRATRVAISSLKATYKWYAAHPFDASDVRGSGHDGTHKQTYAWAHDCSQVAGKDVLAEAGGKLVYVTPDGTPIYARDDAWQDGQRPKVKLIAYETDDTGSVAAQKMKQADALDVVEAMAADDDEEEEAEEEESEEEEKSDAPPAQRARTTS